MWVSQNGNDTAYTGDLTVYDLPEFRGLVHVDNVKRKHQYLYRNCNDIARYCKQ